MKVIRMVLISLLIICLISIQVSQTIVKSNYEKDRATRLLSVTTEPIVIMNNASFAAYASSGSGDKTDPYILSNLQFNVFDEEHAIYISHTDAYFVLLDCIIVTNRVYIAIQLNNVTNGVIEHCNVVGAGVTLSNSNRCAIVDTSILDSKSEAGIEIYFSKDNMITGNTIGGCPTGLFLLGCENIHVTSNQFIDNTDIGIDLYLSANTTLNDNVLVNNGLFLSLLEVGSDGFTIAGSQYISVPYNLVNNTVNGKPIGFFQGITGGTVAGTNYGQVILLNCSDVKVTGGLFTNTSVGIQVHYSVNCSIEESLVEKHSMWGMYIYFSNYTSILSCLSQSNAGSSIFLEHSHNTTITNCTLEKNTGTGLNAAYSDNCTISDNLIQYNSKGIIISQSKNCLITRNDILYNSLIGITLNAGSYFTYVYDNSIGWNTGSNAFVDSADTFWDDGISLGNRWSDYVGFGVYEIEYSGVDHYPSFLGNPLQNPTNMLLISVTIITILIAVIIYLKKFKK